MFWHRGTWESIDQKKAQDVATKINHCIQQQQKADQEQSRETGNHSVEEARKRKLGFYSDRDRSEATFWCYEITWSLKNSEYRWDEYDSSAKAFFVCKIVKNSNGEKDKIIEVFTINWDSAVLHELNAKYIHLPKPQPPRDFSQKQEELLRDYLNFFCSFIAGAKNTRDNTGHPFLIVTGGTWAEPLKIKFGTSETFEERIAYQEPKANNWFLQDKDTAFSTVAADRADLPQDVSSASQPQEPAETQSGIETAKPPPPQSVAESDSTAFTGQDKKETGTREITDLVRKSSPVADSTTAAEIWYFSGYMVYQGSLFQVDLSVDASTGNVTMTNAVKVFALSGWLPLIVRMDRFGDWVLLKAKEREGLSPADFLNPLLRKPKDLEPEDPKPEDFEPKNPPGHDGSAGHTVVRYKRVDGDLDLRCHPKFDCAIEMEDVEIVGSVFLDDSYIGTTIRLVNCKIAGMVSAKNALIDGDLGLERCTIYGMQSQRIQSRVPPNRALWLDGCVIKGSLTAQSLDVTGSISAKNLQADGHLDFRGLNLKRRESDDDSDPILSASHARINGSVNLSPAEPPVGSYRRTRIDGKIDLSHVTAKEFDLRGAEIAAKVDLSYAETAGLVNLAVHWKSVPYRTRVGVEVTMRALKAREVWLGGSHLGSLDMVFAKIETAIFGDIHGIFRLHIDSDLVLSGAAVGSDIRLYGARIDRRLIFRTGTAGRLLFGAGFLQHFESGQWFSAVVYAGAGSVDIRSVRIEADIALLGLETESTVEILDTKLGDGLYLFTEDFEALIDRHSDDFGVPRNDIKWRSYLRPRVPSNEGYKWVERCPKASDVPARITGKLDLRNLITGAHANLTNAVINGPVNLEGARIGGDLIAKAYYVIPQAQSQTKEAKPPTPLSCKELNIEMARFEGDVILSGLALDPANSSQRVFRNKQKELRRRFWGKPLEPLLDTIAGVAARGLKVRGRLEFYDLETKLQAAIPGKLDLSHAEAAWLTISGEFFKDKVRDIDLEHSVFKRLDLKEPFPVEVNMTNLRVDHWEVEHNDYISMLSRTYPFDRGNYTDIEKTLWNEGDTKSADRIYRAMVNRSTDTKTPWIAFLFWLLLLATIWLLNAWPEPDLTLADITGGWETISKSASAIVSNTDEALCKRITGIHAWFPCKSIVPGILVLLVPVLLLARALWTRRLNLRGWVCRLVGRPWKAPFYFFARAFVGYFTQTRRMWFLIGLSGLIAFSAIYDKENFKIPNALHDWGKWDAGMLAAKYTLPLISLRDEEDLTGNKKKYQLRDGDEPICKICRSVYIQCRSSKDPPPQECKQIGGTFFWAPNPVGEFIFPGVESITSHTCKVEGNRLHCEGFSPASLMRFLALGNWIFWPLALLGFARQIRYRRALQE